MFTSLLYHGFGIRGYHYVRTDYSKGRIKFCIQQNKDNPVIIMRSILFQYLLWNVPVSIETDVMSPINNSLAPHSTG